MDSLLRRIKPGIRRLILIVWILGFVLLIIGMTDFFTQSPFRSNYVMQWLLMAFALISLIDFAKKTRKR